MKSRSFLYLAGVAGLAIGGSTSAYAQVEQTAADDQSNVGIAEIVVTAQKRAENVQDVPIAISAFTANSLQERAVGDVSSLSNISPNVTLDTTVPYSGSSSVLSAYIRGIGQNDFAANLDPGVGVYLDGVYLARTVGANVSLPDVERVEVLKGPQGTLFGRNTIGGAISIVTRDPGRDYEFQGNMTGGSFNRFDINASMSVPLTDTLAVSLTGASLNRSGYLERVPFPGSGSYVTDNKYAFRSSGLGSGKREGGQNEWMIRGKLMWEASDRLTVRLAGDYLKQDSEGTATKLLAVTSDLPGAFAPTSDRALVIPDLGATALYDAASGLAPNGFNFAGLYNFCINSSQAEIAARNAAALCGPRGTPLNPSQQIGGLASANADGNPNNDRLPFDNRFLIDDPDKSYATGNNFSRMKNWGLSLTLDYELADDLAVKSITGYRDLVWAGGHRRRRIAGARA